MVEATVSLRGALTLCLMSSHAGNLRNAPADIRQIARLRGISKPRYGALRRRAGLGVVIGRTLGNGSFLLGVTAMAVAFFTLLFALSWGDVSLVAPAAASLTFIGNAVAAKIFLHERVDRRRWIAAGLVAAGVALLAG